MKHLAFFLILALRVFAEDIYVAQTAQGGDTGVDAANAHSVAWLNTSGNWGVDAGDVSPGDTVVLNGNITTAIVAPASGSAGNIITILFAPGATMSKSVWIGKVITLDNRSYITVDGGATGTIGGYTGDEGLANGIIECTDNGTNLGNQEDCTGVSLSQSSNCVVKNLFFKNLYVRPSGSDTLGYGAGINTRYNGSASPSYISVENCVFKDMSVGFFTSYGPASTDIEMVECTAYNVNWGGAAGDHGSSSTMTNLMIRNNYFHDFVNWDQPGNQFHHNGFYAWAESGGTLNDVTMEGNVVGPNFSVGSPNNATSGLFVSGAGVTGTVLIYNNLFIENASDSPSNGLVFIWPGASAVSRVYNNTFIGGGSGNAMQLYGGRGTAGQQTFDVKNNIGVAKTFINVANNATISLTSSYNLGYNLISGQNFSYSATSSSNFYTFAGWQGLGYDLVGSNIGDPELDADYAPQQGSPAIDAGADLSAHFTTDQNGKVRAVPWDIGAYEFGATPGSGSLTTPSITVGP